MFAPQPWPQGSTITNPHAALSPQPFSDEFLLMLLEPETQRPKSYWMTMVGCLMISLSCLAVLALSAAQR